VAIQDTDAGKDAARLRRLRHVAIGYTAVRLQLGSAIGNTTRLRRLWRAATGYTSGYARPDVLIASVALVLSMISIYATVWVGPILKVYAGCNWRYARGVPDAGTDVEYFVVPVTVVNDGARTGTVLAVDLAVEKGGSSTPFTANFIGTRFDDKIQMFAPIAVAGHASASYSIIFTQLVPTEAPLFGERGPLRATLRIGPAPPVGLFAALFASPVTERRFELVASAFEEKPVSFPVNNCATEYP
jgi:hypothetical protein